MAETVITQETTKRWLKRRTVLSAKATTGAGTGVNVSSYKNIQLKITSQGSFNGTVKIQGSLSLEEPTWDSAASATNSWDYVAAFDLIDPTTVIPGGTGVSASGTDIGTKNLLVNVDGITWLNAVVTARSAGSVNVELVAMDNA